MQQLILLQDLIDYLMRLAENILIIGQPALKQLASSATRRLLGAVQEEVRRNNPPTFRDRVMSAGRRLCSRLRLRFYLGEDSRYDQKQCYTSGSETMAGQNGGRILQGLRRANENFAVQ